MFLPCVNLFRAIATLFVVISRRIFPCHRPAQGASVGYSNDRHLLLYVAIPLLVKKLTGRHSKYLIGA